MTRSAAGPAGDAACADLHLHTRFSHPVATPQGCGAGAGAASLTSVVDPEEAYDVARRRGMSFVAVTDRGTLEGALSLRRYSDVLLGEECVVRDEPHQTEWTVLVLGLQSEADHRALRRAGTDAHALRTLADTRGWVTILADPLEALLAAPHDAPAIARRQAALFPLWQTRSGWRSSAVNEATAALHAASLPAADLSSARRPSPLSVPGAGGSGAFTLAEVARTYTITPPAATPSEFLAHLRAGRARATGGHGVPHLRAHRTYASWLHELRRLPPRAARERLGYRLDVALIAGVAACGGDTMARYAEDVVAEQFDSRLIARTALDLVVLLTRHGVRFIDAVGAVSELAAHTAQADAELWLGANVHADRLRARVSAALRGGRLGATRRAVGSALAHVALEAPLVLAARELALEGEACARLRVACADAPLAPAPAPTSAVARAVRAHGTPPRRPRVAIMLDAADHQDGVTITYANLSRAFAVTGLDVVEVTALSHDSRRREDTLALPPLTETPAPYYEEYVLRTPALPDVLEMLRRRRIDLVHLATPGPIGTIALIAARMLGLPVLAAYHTELPEYARLLSNGALTEKFIWKTVRLWFGECERVLAPSQATLAQLAANGFRRPGQLGLFPKGVDTVRFTPNRRHAGFWRSRGLHRDRVIVYVGRVSVEKGLDVLFEAWRQLRALDPGLGLAVVGDGPYRPALTERFAGDDVLFTGFLGGDELAAAYASSDLFLFPSVTDTFGLVVLEALASGLPAIVSDTGGPCETVRHGHTGLVVRAGDAAGFAAAAWSLVSDRAQRDAMGHAARRAAEATSWTTAALTLEEEYTALLGSRLAPAAWPAAGAWSHEGRLVPAL